MTMKFTAKGVAATVIPRANVHIVLFAEDPDGGDGVSLEIGRSLTDTQQDRDLGFDTYSLCLNAGPTTYGGIRSYGFTDSRLFLNLDERAQRELGLDAKLSIVLAVDPATIESARVALISILKDVSVIP